MDFKAKPTAPDTIPSDSQDTLATKGYVDEQGLGNYYIVGNNTGTAGIWTGSHPDISSYYPGLSIFYAINIAGASGLTLNINGLGPVPVLQKSTTSLSTQFAINHVVHLVYQADGKFRAVNFSDTNYYDRTYRNNAITISHDPLYSYKLIGQTVSGTWAPMMLTNKTSTAVVTPYLVSTQEFLIGGQIEVYDTTATVAVGSTLTNKYSELATANVIRYSLNVSSVTNGKFIYLRGTIGPNGGFLIDPSNFVAQDLPTSADGKVYLLLGYAYSTTALRLIPTHPVFEYIDGKIRQYTGVTAKTLGLDKLTNNKQIQARASSTSGYIPTWDGNSGDKLAAGYSVETTLSGGNSALPRADAVKTYVDNEINTISLTPGPKGDPGDVGPKGDTGDTWKPAVSVAGDLTWTKDSGATTPTARNIRGPQGVAGSPGTPGVKGDTGDTWKPAVDVNGNLTWSTASGTPASANIKGPQGSQGATGDTWKPAVDALGNLTWTKDSGATTPTARNIRGPQGLAGEKGDPGDVGPPGSDANVTYANVTSALGYIPVKKTGDTMTGALAVSASGATAMVSGHNTFTTTNLLAGVRGTTPSAGSGYLGTFRNNATTGDGDIRAGVYGLQGSYSTGETNYAGYFEGRVRVSGKIEMVSATAEGDSDVTVSTKGYTDERALPSGGDAEQILVKNSNNDYDSAWITSPFMLLSGGVLENYTEKVKTLLGSGNVTIDLLEGNVFKHTLTGDVNYSITNAISGNAHSFTLILEQGATAREVEFANNIQWRDYEEPHLDVANATHMIMFFSINGGSTWLTMYGGLY